METINLKLSPREVTGKKVKRLRRDGVIPVHFYGRGTEALALQVEAAVLRRILPRVGTSVPLTVELDGKGDENICFVREVQRHPVTEDILHVDFLRVDVSQTITADVPIVLEGVSPAVTDLGGTLLQILDAVQVEALPMRIPGSFTVDVSILDDFDKTIRVESLALSADATVLADPGQMIATVVRPRIEEEPVDEEEEDLLAEGEEAEGEEGADEATEASEE
jgi:large subunit ribosomal protein L25